MCWGEEMVSFVRRSIARKIGFALFLFSIPTAYIMHELIKQQNISIAFGEKELEGTFYLRALTEAHFILIRNELEIPAPKLDNAVSLIRAAQEKHGAEMKSAEKADTAIVALTEAEKTSLSGETGTAARAAIAALNTRVGDLSNLILDPDLDSYYEMDMTLIKMPDILDRVTELALQSRAAHRDGIVDADETLTLHVMLASLQTVMGGLNASLDSAYTGNADGTVKAALDAPFADYKNNLEAVVEKWVHAAPDAQELATGIASLEKLYGVTSSDLERLLSIRVDGFLANQRLKIALTALLFLIVFAGTIWFVRRTVIRPLSQTTRCTQQLAAGDLDTKIFFVNREDEVGDIARALQVFQGNLFETEQMRQEEQRKARSDNARREQYDRLFRDFESTVSLVVSTVSHSAEDMRQYAKALNTHASDTSQRATIVAEGADQAATNVATVAAATEELTASIHEITRQVADSAQIAHAAMNEARLADKAVSSLSDAANKIGEVVQMISEIAEQTNLLALNATIEAARAGEAGKGFAVVASEVKNLASQTAGATEEITGQITTMQHVVREAVQAIQGMSRTIEQINTGASAIAAAVEEQGAATSEIARNVQEASTSAKNVSANIGTVSDAANKTGDVASSVLNAASSLAEESARLQSEVETFIQGMRAA